MDGNAQLTAMPLAAVNALLEEEAPAQAIYLPNSTADKSVLFRCAGGGELPKPDFDRLQTAGVTHLLIGGEDLARCESALEENLAVLLRDPRVDPLQKAACVRHFGVNVAREMLVGDDLPTQIERASVLFDAIVENVLTNEAACGTLLTMCGHHRSTASHMFAVGALAILLGHDVLGPDPARLRQLGLAGMVHDLGKMSVPTDLLRKNTPLTDDELDVLRHHPIESVRLLGDDATVSSDVRLMVLQHHERFDGRGYPLGLAGPDLLPESRILAIVDSFHAMIGRRDYRQPLNPVQALRLMRYQSGKQFDPELLTRWASVFQRNWRLMDSRALGPDEDGAAGSGYHADHRRAAPRRVQRRSARLPCKGPLAVPCAYTGRLARVSSAPEQFISPVGDISRSGLCLATQHPMYRGEVVSVRVSAEGKDVWLRAVVRWCRRETSNESFKTGVQFLQRIPASEALEAVPVIPTSGLALPRPGFMAIRGT